MLITTETHTILSKKQILWCASHDMKHLYKQQPQPNFRDCRYKIWLKVYEIHMSAKQTNKQTNKTKHQKTGWEGIMEMRVKQVE